jgi:hypothetical protein
MKYLEVLNNVNTFLRAPYHALVAAVALLTVLWYVVFRQFDKDAPKSRRVEPKPSKRKTSKKSGKRSRR